MILTLDALGLGLRAIRLHNKMTLAEVATRSGLSISFLSDIERDKTRPSLATLQKLATCYGEPFKLIIPRRLAAEVERARDEEAEE